ncbi:MAG: pilus assembly protein PilM [Candidatus Omnitrophica bacterium]|nr:pilus assembly protein PilM [Candidatus Omnitrophota bacterium]
MLRNMPLYKYFTNKSGLEIGVDIGFGALKIAIVQVSGKEYKLLAYKCEDLSSVKEDDKDKAIVKTTQEFIKTYGLFKKSIHLNISLANSVFTKTLKLPSMPEREIPNAAKWQIKDEVSASLDDLEFTWQYLFGPEKAKKPRVDIICVLAKKKFLSRYVEIFKSANIELSEITLSPFSLNSILPKEEEWVIVLDVGNKQSVLSFHSKGRLLFLRTIHVGAESFTAQQSQEQVKLNVEHLSDEAVRSIKYCELEFAKQALNHIYITGGGARIEVLPAALKESSNLDVKILRFPRNIQIDEKIRKDYETERASLQILPAIGAAIPSQSKINILPMEARAAKMLLWEKVSLRLIGITAALILLSSFFTAQLKINVLKYRLNNINTETNFLKEAQALKAEIDDYGKIINYIKANCVPSEWPLKFIASSMSEDMVLSSFTFNNKDKGVSASGVVYARPGSVDKILTDFIRRLKQIEIFKDVKMISMEKSSSGEAFTFTISCKLEL